MIPKYVLHLQKSLTSPSFFFPSISMYVHTKNIKYREMEKSPLLCKILPVANFINLALRLELFKYEDKC